MDVSWILLKLSGFVMLPDGLAGNRSSAEEHLLNRYRTDRVPLAGILFMK